MFPMPWTPPYYEQYLVDAGYARAYPLWVYEVDFAYERYRDFTRRRAGVARVHLREVDKRRWDEEVETLRLIWNEGFSERVGVPAVHGAAQFSEFFKDMKPIARLAHVPDRRGGRRACRARAGECPTSTRLSRDARPAGPDQAPAHDPCRAPSEPGRPAGDRGAAAVPRAADRRDAGGRPCTATSSRWGCKEQLLLPRERLERDSHAAWPSRSAARAESCSTASTRQL